MYIPLWANQPVPPHIDKAWTKAVAGMVLALGATGAFLSATSDRADMERIKNLTSSQVRATYPGLAHHFTKTGRAQAMDTCAWLQTPTSACTETQEVRQAVTDLRMKASITDKAGLLAGVLAITLLASSLRGLKPQ